MVHRPRYDDWSLPKGKLDRGEHPAAAAVRECREETGFGAQLSRRLGTSSYSVMQDGQVVDKQVLWWAARALDGSFTPGPEVDALRWLPPAAAAQLVTAQRDVPVLSALTALAEPLATVIVLRHARALRRHEHSGPDDTRPLDARGRGQAERIADLLALWGVERLVSAPPSRCVATLAPAEDRLGIAVVLDPWLGDAAHRGDPARALTSMLSHAAEDRPVAMCTQGEALPALLTTLAQQSGHPPPPDGFGARKAHGWVLTLRRGRLVAADAIGPDSR